MRYEEISPADEARLAAEEGAFDDEFEDALEAEWLAVYGPPEPARLEPRRATDQVAPGAVA